MPDTAPDYTLQDITVLVVNYRTLDLTERCVTSLRAHYPLIQLILVDNGSADASTTFIRELAAEHTFIQAILNGKNLHHGPALHQALRAAKTRFAFTLDSDCRVLQAGFLEAMLACFEDPLLYAVGRLVHMNRFGYEISADLRSSCQYVHPSAMLLDRQKYLRLKPFFHHGSPGLRNMQCAARAGYHLKHFPLDAYIDHQGRGTCSRYGYDLGIRHLVEYFLNQIPILTR